MERCAADPPIRSFSRSFLLPLLATLPVIALTGLSLHGLVAEEIHLKNGDRLSGHIWRIGPKSMLLETPYATLWIEQIFIDRITVADTEPRVRVRPRAGKPFEGTLVAATGSDLIFRVEEEQVRRIPWADVESVSFYEPEKK